MISFGEGRASFCTFEEEEGKSTRTAHYALGVSFSLRDVFNISCNLLSFVKKTLWKQEQSCFLELIPAEVTVKNILPKTGWEAIASLSCASRNWSAFIKKNISFEILECILLAQKLHKARIPFEKIEESFWKGALNEPQKMLQNWYRENLKIKRPNQ